MLSEKNLVRSAATIQPASWDENPKLLFRLICSQMWAQLQKELQSKEGSDSKYFLPILHFACRFQCPLEALQLLDEKFPNSVSSADNKGKWPIHYAAEYGAPCDIIKYLAARDPKSAGAQDDDGMTPIHHLCAYYSKAHQPSRDGGRKTKDCLLYALKKVVQAAPTSINLEDNNEMNAVEYAIDSELDGKIVKLLQNLCVLQHKKANKQKSQKNSNDGKGSQIKPTRPLAKKKSDIIKVSAVPILDISPTKSSIDRAYAA